MYKTTWMQILKHKRVFTFGSRSVFCFLSKLLEDYFFLLSQDDNMCNMLKLGSLSQLLKVCKLQNRILSIFFKRLILSLFIYRVVFLEFCFAKEFTYLVAPLHVWIKHQAWMSSRLVIPFFFKSNKWGFESIIIVAWFWGNKVVCSSFIK